MPPTIASSSQPSHHSSVQFLNMVLSQRGSDSLPYEENMKVFVKQHLVSLIKEFSSLKVKNGKFTYNDGKVVNLLQADGTIPMYYKDVIYNIPVTIWVLERYPRISPRVFVNPTRNMIIKRPHRNVDGSGLVAVPYLQNWVFPRSNLVELVQSLSIVFGEDPPLYSKPNTPPARNSATSSKRMSSMHAEEGVSTSHYPSSSVSPSHVYPTGSYPYFRQLPSLRRANSTENPSDVFKGNAINSLEQRLQHDKHEIRKALEMEMDKLMDTQGVLRQREEQLRRAVQDLQEEKEELEQNLQVILTNTDVLETWLNDSNKGILEFHVDDAFEPCDILSKQMLESASADLTIEDVLYSLDKAVQEGVIPVDNYLKHIRTLSREQFFHRAAYVRLRAAQVQSQIASMAARAVP